MIVAASQKLIFLDCLNHLSDSPSSISIKASLQVQPSHMVILPCCLATKEFLLLLRVSKCRWRAGVRLSGGNQSQAGVLGLWPTNCTHPAAGETNSSWPLLPTRIIQPVCHRLGQSVQPMDSSTLPLVTDGRLVKTPENGFHLQERCVPVLVSYGGAFQGFLIWVTSRLGMDGRWSKPAHCSRAISPTSFHPILNFSNHFFFKHKSFGDLVGEKLNSILLFISNNYLWKQANLWQGLKEQSLFIWVNWSVE